MQVGSHLSSACALYIPHHPVAIVSGWGPVGGILGTKVGHGGDSVPHRDVTGTVVVAQKQIGPGKER